MVFTYIVLTFKIACTWYNLKLDIVLFSFHILVMSQSEV